MKPWYDFIALLYPRICPSCGYALFRNEKVICTRCLYKLPRTGFHLSDPNPVSGLFWGRVHVEYGASMLWYRKGNRVQTLIHRFKYKGVREIGSFLGELYGHDLKNCHQMQAVDLIIPVPLHEKKQRKRGFNQSEIIARGISIALSKPVDCTLLTRKSASDTQTRKSRYNRWENVSEIFEVSDPARAEGKNILLIDDVITTGSTLEACAQKLLEIKGVKIFVASLAYSSK
ncbi:MAG: ComF family protein [Bacteroidales bacterium]|nr:ComF family protein [Bacteroidales bacterium]